MLNEFKIFIAKGNVIDMAVGIIIGAAFTAIVTSMVEDLINPLLGLFIGGVDFSEMSFGFGAAQFMYGNFINAVIKFLIVAWVVFLLVKAVNRMKNATLRRQAPIPVVPVAPEVPKGPTAEELLMEIRDALKAAPR